MNSDVSSTKIVISSLKTDISCSITSSFFQNSQKDKHSNIKSDFVNQAKSEK